MRPDWLIERRLRSWKQSRAERFGYRGNLLADALRCSGRISHRVEDRFAEFQRGRQSPPSFLHHQLAARRRGLRLPRLRVGDRRVRRRTQQHRCEIDGGYSVDYAVMGLADHREAIAVESLDYPQFPERFAAIELLRGDSSGQSLELLVAPGPRQRSVPHVIFKIEAIVVHPHRMILKRYPSDPLSITRNEMQSRYNVFTDLFDIDSAVGSPKRTGVEDRHARNVHVRFRIFEVEERPVQGAKPFVIGHSAASSRRARDNAVLAANRAHDHRVRSGHQLSELEKAFYLRRRETQAKFARRYIVTTAAPPSPRLCWRATLAPDTCRLSAS